MMDFGEIITSYTAAQAVEDGMLVEVPADILRALNVRVPAYVTTNLYRRHVEVLPFSSLIDERSAERLTHLRLSQLVRAASVAFRAGDTSDMMRTNIMMDGTAVWGVIDGDGVTLMLPEDY